MTVSWEFSIVELSKRDESSGDVERGLCAALVSYYTCC